MRSWDLDQLHCSKIYKLGDPVTQLEFVEDRNMMLALTSDKQVLFVDLGKEAVVKQLRVAL